MLLLPSSSSYCVTQEKAPRFLGAGSGIQEEVLCPRQGQHNTVFTSLQFLQLLMSQLTTKDLKYTEGKHVEAPCYFSLSEARLYIPVLYTQSQNGLQYMKGGDISCVPAPSNSMAFPIRIRRFFNFVFYLGTLQVTS